MKTFIKTRPLYLLSISVIVIFLMSCSKNTSIATSNVRRAPAQTSSDGFFYFLPKTVITTDVSVTKITHQPGPFAQYAESLLGLKQVIRTPAVDFVISEVRLNSYAEPDMDHLYFVENNPADSPIYITLSESGLIRGVNIPVDRQEAFKLIGEHIEDEVLGREASFNYFIDINLQEKIDTILERVRMDTITVERQRLQRSWVEKSTDVRAKEVADHILKIRDKKFDLITGFAEITYSKEALEYMYTEMMKKENDYLSLFTGLSSSNTVNYRFTFTPEVSASGNAKVLFYFSPREGLLDNNIPGSVPVSIEAKRDQSSQLLASLTKRIHDDRQTKRGFFYRIPEYSNVVVTEGNTNRAESRMLISQFGVVTSLPPHVTEIEFHPNTGAIRSAGRIIEPEP